MHLPTFLPLLISLTLSPCLANDDPGVLNHTSITSLPSADRRSAYLNADGDTQARIWTERLEAYRNAHEDLSSDQRNVLDRFEQNIQHADEKGEEEVNDELEQIGDDAIVAFGIDEASRVLASLSRLDGKDTSPGFDNIDNNRKKASRDDNGQPGDAGALAADCNCGGAPTCIPGGACLDSNCVRQPSGCGWRYKQPCTGICFKPPK